MSQERHAFLVLAHKNQNQLSLLLRLLDHPQNDIYLHLDKRSRVDAAALQSAVRQGTLAVSSIRHSAWGSEALIDAMTDLLAEATAAPHAYYHFISGMDLPLKPPAEIHAFFSNAQNAEFVDFKAGTVSDGLLSDRLRTYHFFQGLKERHPLFRSLDNVLLRVQSLLHVNRLKRCNIRFQKGSQWLSITHEFAIYCLKHAPEYRRCFRFSKCGDELFFQTILQNSPFLSKRYWSGYDDDRATMRFIDWDRGNGSSPYVFHAEDYERIMKSGMLFARKFDETVDSEIIERIACSVRQQK